MSNKEIIGDVVLLVLMVVNIVDSIISVSKPGFLSSYLGIGRKGRIIMVIVNIVILAVFCWLTYYY